MRHCVCLWFFFVFFFFKQKTAYEMRISDWSSDVCSSDLLAAQILFRLPLACSIDDRQEQASDSVRMVGQPPQGAVQKFSAKRMIAASFKFLTWATGMRSEEHTSELQSLMRISYAVFCLKKKTKQLP